MKVAERVSSLALGTLWIGHKLRGPHTLSRSVSVTLDRIQNDGLIG